MAAFVKFYTFTQDVAHKLHDLSADTLKIMLSNTAPALSATIAANITQVTAGFGYTAGGNTVTTTSSGQTTGDYKLVLADLSISASGGTIGPYRYAVLVNATANRLIGYWDYTTSVSILDGNVDTIDLDNALGTVRIA